MVWRCDPAGIITLNHGKTLLFVNADNRGLSTKPARARQAMPLRLKGNSCGVKLIPGLDGINDRLAAAFDVNSDLGPEQTVR